MNFDRFEVGLWFFHKNEVTESTKLRESYEPPYKDDQEVVNAHLSLKKQRLWSLLLFEGLFLFQGHPLYQLCSERDSPPRQARFPAPAV